MLHRPVEPGQYTSIAFTERLAEADVDASVGAVGDALDNALAESVIGLYKTELIRRRGPWRTVEHVEAATLNWVDWFNRHRLLETNGASHPSNSSKPTTVNTPTSTRPDSQPNESPETPGRFTLDFETVTCIRQDRTCLRRVRVLCNERQQFTADTGYRPAELRACANESGPTVLIRTLPTSRRSSALVLLTSAPGTLRCTSYREPPSPPKYHALQSMVPAWDRAAGAV